MPVYRNRRLRSLAAVAAVVLPAAWMLVTPISVQAAPVIRAAQVTPTPPPLQAGTTDTYDVSTAGQLLYIDENFYPLGSNPGFVDATINLENNITLPSGDLPGSAYGNADDTCPLNGHPIVSIDFENGSNWIPLGVCGPSAAFRGTFNGNGYAVTGLDISVSSEQSGYAPVAGLFGATAPGSVVANVLVSGTISPRYVDQLNESEGLLAGWGAGTFKDDASSGSVEGLGSIGGLVGELPGVSYPDSAYASVTDSWSTASVSAYYSNSVSPTFAGGLVGTDDGVLHNDYAEGAVTGLAGSQSACEGGVAGAIGEPFNFASNAGDNDDIPDPYLEDTYDAGGRVSPGLDSYAGGIVGCEGTLIAPFQPAKLVGNYWDVTTSGLANGVGGIAGNTSGATGVSDTAMTNPQTFQGWDFVQTWGESGTVNHGYPYLRPTFPAIEGQVPEVPWAAPLPLIGVGALWLARRRRMA